MSGIEPGTLWRIELRGPAFAAPALASVLEGISVAVNSFEDKGDLWRVEGYTDAPPDERALREGIKITADALGIAAPGFTIELLTPRDWLAENLASFEPLRLGRVFVHPSHFDGRPPVGSIALEIDAATAFGSGAHPTTSSCAEAIQDVLRRRTVRRALDMGCGSGLLAFVMVRLGVGHVVATDIDPEASRVARLNARINRIGDALRVSCGVGYRPRQVAAGAPYDLIVANVLARPLKAMAGDLAEHLAPGGTAILSGLIRRDAAGVAAMHRAHGLRLVRQIDKEDWATLVMRKLGPRA